MNNKQKAFTIVELSIVIVVIGILAAISIVACNGIQNRARDTSVKESAIQLMSKLEVYSGIKGSLPTYSEILGGLDESSDPAEAAVPSGIISQVGSANVTATSANKIQIIINNNGTPPNHKCIIVNFYQNTGANGRRTIG